MLERLIDEAKDRHSKRPISQEAYSKWLNATVTKRLFEDLELSVIDSFQDYLPEDSVDSAAMQAMVRQGAAQMVERVLDWAPKGLEIADDEE